MKPITTFLVEDSPVIRQSLIATLEELSQVRVVGTADDEATAIDWLQQQGNAVDLVIIDLFLKSGTGLGVLRRMRDHLPGCILVVLSNYATRDMRQKCLTLGATRVFDKSQDIDGLILYCNQLSNGEHENESPQLLQ
jgi:DNA-binding NarL/FixJ family response regulator